MDFSMSSEQAAIRDLATDVFREHGSDEHVRRCGDAGETFDAHLWKTLCETGLVNVALPEALGGSGLGMLELGLVLQQQGRYLGAVPLWSHALATSAIATQGQASLRERVLPALVEGTRIAALATEFESQTGLEAKHTAEGWTLAGSLDGVLLDDCQQWLLLPAESAEGRRLFLVAADQPGMSATRGELTDHQTIRDLTLRDVRVPHDAMLERGAIDWLVPRMASCVSVMQLGATEEALRRAAAYAGERHQFGRPIGSFQALAVRAADSYIEVELLRSAHFQVAWRIDQGLPAMAAARVAKHQASQAGHIVGHTAAHFHGGVGSDLTYPFHRFYLKCQALSHIGGGAEAQLAQIGRVLAGPAPEEYEFE